MRTHSCVSLGYRLTLVPPLFSEAEVEEVKPPPRAAIALSVSCAAGLRTQCPLVIGAAGRHLPGRPNSRRPDRGGRLV